MKKFSIEDKTFPSMLIGSSPFCGAGQFRERAQIYFKTFYEQPANITYLLVKMARQGYRGAHILGLKPIVEAVRDAYVELGESFPVIATIMPGQEEEQWDWLSQINTSVGLMHAAATDTLNLGMMNEFTKKCRERGMIPGFATHNGGHTIPFLDETGVDASVYLCPFNKTGTHVHPSLEETLNALRKTKKKVIGMKILACGELKPDEAFEYSLPYVDAITVGMVTEQEVEENAFFFDKHHELLGTLRER